MSHRNICMDARADMACEDGVTVRNGYHGRGLSGVRLVVSDARVGLARAIAECLSGAGWQRCVVHLERGVCSLLASSRHRAMA